MTRTRVLATIIGAALCASGCPGFGDQEVEGVFVTQPDNLVVTYDQHIEKLSDYYCSYCHTPGSGRAPDSRPLHVYDGVDQFAVLSVGRIRSVGNPMPPVAESNPMSEVDIAYWQRWIDCGRPATAADAKCPDGEQPGNNGNNGNNGPAPGLTYEKDIKPIFSNTCTFVGCHGGAAEGDLPSTLNFETFDEIVFGDTVFGLPGLVPCDPDSSPIAARIQLPADNPSLMPQFGPPIPQEQIDTIITWIREGDDIKPLCGANNGNNGVNNGNNGVNNGNNGAPLCEGLDACVAGCADPNTFECNFDCVQDDQPCRACLIEGATACASRLCSDELDAFLSCYQDCAAADDTDACLIQLCDPEYTAFKACLEPAWADGQCDDDLAACAP